MHKESSNATEQGNAPVRTAIDWQGVMRPVVAHTPLSECQRFLGLLERNHGICTQTPEGMEQLRQTIAAAQNSHDKLREALQDALENMTCLSNNAHVPPHRYCDCCGCSSARVIEAALKESEAK